MHLPYLSELADRFELVAVCDIAPEVRPAAAPSATALAECSPAVGGHDRRAARCGAGRDLRRPRADRDRRRARPGATCLSRSRWRCAAAMASGWSRPRRDAGVCVMVGTMKRYDPAYERLAELLPSIVEDVRLIRVTTLESPIAAYVAHYPLIGARRQVRAAASRARASRAGGRSTRPWATPTSRRAGVYRRIVVQTLVHEFNMLGGLLGDARRDPVGVAVAAVRRHQHALRRDRVPPVVGVAAGHRRYRQELAFYAPGKRLTLELPSPFLRSMPSRLIVEGGESAPRTAGSARRSSPTTRRSGASWSSSPIASRPGESRARRAPTGCATCGSPRRSPGWTRRYPSRRPSAGTAPGGRRTRCSGTRPAGSLCA